MDTKVCTTCGVEKPIAEFYKMKAGKFGREANGIMRRIQSYFDSIED